LQAREAECTERPGDHRPMVEGPTPGQARRRRGMGKERGDLGSGLRVPRSQSRASLSASLEALASYLPCMSIAEGCETTGKGPQL